MLLCGSKQNQLFGLHSRSQFTILLGSFVYIRFCLLLAFAEHKKRLESAFLENAVFAVAGLLCGLAAGKINQFQEIYY